LSVTSFRVPRSAGSRPTITPVSTATANVKPNTTGSIGIVPGGSSKSARGA